MPCGDGFHKGFYNDSDAKESLSKIFYTDYFDSEPNVEFPYGDASSLLCGSCQLFALSLSKLLGYQVYLIESEETRHFHAFCRVHKEKVLYYIDARGATTSFDEFMDVASSFVPMPIPYERLPHRILKNGIMTKNFYVRHSPLQKQS